MKLLFIRNLNPFFESSASANRYAGIIDGLLNCGVKIDLLITGGYCNKREKRLYGIQKFNKNLQVKYLIHTYNHNIWLRRINTYLLSGLYQFIINMQTKKYFKSDYDYVWLGSETKILNSLLVNQSFLKGKSILELNEYNDLHEGHITSGNFLQHKKDYKENQVFLQTLKITDLLVVMTKTLIAHFKPLAKSSATILHLLMTVDINRFSKPKESCTRLKSPYIAYTGTFNNQKDGVDILIHAFAKIANKFPEYTLYLAGFYHYDVVMQKELINRYNLIDRILYLNQLNNTEVVAFLQNAQLLVMARPDTRQARGGFPTKLGEYLASGNPVCVTRVGEIPDYLIDNESVFFANPGDINSFADAMQRALIDTKHAKRVGVNGQVIAQTVFNSEVQVQRLYDFLKHNISSPT